MLGNVNWLWLVIGILAAWFVIPFVMGKVRSTKTAPSSTRAA